MEMRLQKAMLHMLRASYNAECLRTEGGITLNMILFVNVRIVSEEL